MTKKNWIRYVIAFLLMLVALAGVSFFTWVLPTCHIGSGYVAKVVGSAVFTAGRSVGTARMQEVKFLDFVSVDVNPESKTVTASVYGIGRQTAKFREGLGVSLSHNEPFIDIGPRPLTKTINNLEERAWPQGNQTELPGEAYDLSQLNAVLEQAFTEGTRQYPVYTRAVVVIHHGRLIAERYADGFDENSRLAGWSMTKSLVNALIGILVHQKKLRVHDQVNVSEWSNPSDPRHELTVHNLLQMQSGLAFSEKYSEPLGDVTKMLFAQPDASRFAASKPLQYQINTHWSYSSGTTNILCRMIRNIVGEEKYWTFPQEFLFNPTGMHSAIIEVDANGTFIGSSFGWMTARDWARFGQLFLNKGVWSGSQLLPEGWIKYTTTPASKAKGRYGAHWWLNDPKSRFPNKQPLPDCPSDTYFASGFEGQRLFIIPSRDAVVVRLGLTQQRGAFDFNSFLKDILNSLPE